MNPARNEIVAAIPLLLSLILPDPGNAVCLLPHKSVNEFGFMALVSCVIRPEGFAADVAFSLKTSGSCA